ncbi:hypothetical protein TNCV_2825781 [Trichonephila clavipes]|nr:hypothetical protein TNCV_2825781 [Trichonephila clavipes]
MFSIEQHLKEVNFRKRISERQLKKLKKKESDYVSDLSSVDSPKSCGIRYSGSSGVGSPGSSGAGSPGSSGAGSPGSSGAGSPGSSGAGSPGSSGAGSPGSSEQAPLVAAE